MNRKKNQTTPIFKPKDNPEGDILEDDEGVVPEQEQQNGQ